MIHIDIKTGSVTWGEYKIYRELTHNEFVKGEYNFTVAEDHEVLIVYQLPSLVVGHQPCILQLAYFNFSPYISHIHIDRATINNDYTECWCHEEFQWLEAARTLIRSELGEPHRIEVLQTCRDIPCSDDIKSWFQHWTYKFAWGTAGLLYVEEDITNRIWLGYDISHNRNQH